MTAAVDVVVGVLVRGTTVLLCQRKLGKRYELQWEFPGGKVEPGETCEQALQRELREELGITPLRWEHMRTDVNTYADGGLFEVLAYRIDAWEGTVANHDFHDMQWVEPRQFSAFSILQGNSALCAQIQREVGRMQQQGENDVRR